MSSMGISQVESGCNNWQPRLVFGRSKVRSESGHGLCWLGCSLLLPLYLGTQNRECKLNYATNNSFHISSLSIGIHIFFSSSGPTAQQPNAGQGRLILEISRSHTHNDTRQTVGFLWTRDQIVVETSTWQHNANRRQTSMSPAGHEPAIPASDLLQTLTLDRSATGFGKRY
jgi:hypothetical protein